MGGVLVIGDSHVGGLRPFLSGARFSYTDGSHTAQWVNFNPGDATVVVVSLGTNDISKPRPVEETAAAARQIVQRAAGRLVLWALPPQYGKGYDHLNAIRSSGAQILESLSLPLNGWHPTPVGYQTWAGAIISKLNSMPSGGNVGPSFGAGALSPSATPLLLLLGLVFVVVIRR